MFPIQNSFHNYEFDMPNFDAIALVLSCIEMTARIEKLSRAEHDLISDVHPQVSEIKEKVENVREVVSSERS